MRFGLNFFPSFRLQDMSTAEYFAQSLRLAERGDELGYDSVKTVEHVIEQVEFNRNLIGEHEPSMQINFGGINEREAFRTLELFAARVMPRYHKEEN